MTDEQGSNGRYPANRGAQDRDFPISGQLAADDEISLFDLWEVLRRRRLTILVVFLLFAVGSLAYSLSKEPVHSVESFIELGQVPDTEGEMTFLDGPETVVSRLGNVLIPEARENYLDEQARLPAIEASVVDQSGGLIQLSSEAPLSRAEAMQDFMQRVADDLTAYYANQRRETLSQIDRRIADLDRRLQDMRPAVNASEPALPDSTAGMSSSNQDPESSSIAIAEVLREVLASSLLQDRQADYWALDDRLAALESARARATPTSIEREPTISGSPIGTGARLIVTLGAVLGLMLGVFAAFIREFLANARRHRESSGSQ